MSSYVKTAKDIAWDNERRKLKSEIQKLRKLLADSENFRKQLDERINDQEDIIQNLLEVNGMSREDIRVLIENTKKQNEAADTFIRLAHLDMFY